MSEQTFFSNSNACDYSKGLKRLITDIADEMSTGIKDGFSYKLANSENDDAKLYSLIKNEGYDIAYKEFTDFIAISKRIVDENQQLLEKISNEQISEELSDSDLEQVAGGMAWWKKLLIGVGVALLVACVVIATGGIALPALGAVTAHVVAGSMLCAEAIAYHVAVGAVIATAASGAAGGAALGVGMAK